MENSENIFILYMEKFYEIPKDIKDDIVYCQRAMRDYLKVHSLVTDVFRRQSDADPVQKQKILDELEEDLEEINAEQQYLLLRLDDNLNKFYSMLSKNGIEAIPDLSKQIVAKKLCPLISDQKYEIFPTTVRVRLTEEALIRKHFLVAQEAADEEPALLRTAASFPVSDDNDVIICEDDNVEGEQADGEHEKFGEFYSETSNADSKEDIKVLDEKAKIIDADTLIIMVSDDDSCVADDEMVPKCSTDLEPPLKTKSEKPISTTVADGKQCVPKISESRLNLRQALKRARKTKQTPRVFDEDDNELLTAQKTVSATSSGSAVVPMAKAGIHADTSQANEKKPKEDPLSISGPVSAQNIPLIGASKKVVPIPTYNSGLTQKKVILPKQNKPRKNIVIAAPINNNNHTARTMNVENIKTATVQAKEPVNIEPPTSSSSSDDSNSELQQPQERYFWDDEPRETRTHPEDYGQELFLRNFNLFTHPVLAQMQQRRSKRKRRTIHTTARSDFHYGRIDGQGPTNTEVAKKKKAAKVEFLLSPKVKRLQAKKRQGKRNSPDKNDDAAVANYAHNNNNNNNSSKNSYTLPSYGGSRRSTRSPSISPDAKLKCKECRRRHEPLYPCDVCDYMFHQDCHEDTGKAKIYTKCPMCYTENKCKTKSAVNMDLSSECFEN